ncbi:plasmid mobilization protein [Porphyromonas somerae]|nr:hypothetical protein [Porphyromonas somerae]BDE81933.1 hypothetical protein CE91St14_09610 [Porphyromonas somerae]
MGNGRKIEKIQNKSGEKIVSFRMQNEDFEILNRKMKELNLKTISDYLRFLVSEEEVKVREVYKENPELIELLEELIYQTRMIGVNMNQIAYGVNIGMGIPDDFFPWAKGVIQKINRQYKDLLMEMNRDFTIKERL